MIIRKEIYRKSKDENKNVEKITKIKRLCTIVQQE